MPLKTLHLYHQDNIGVWRFLIILFLL